ncbi:MAG: UDP-N-acetylmuramoyl-tripeptide--D-alanyl-D-alanine ligase, partial [Bacillota bacterium]|nr:UDP-N-acetylmuramoyl-tripeptide--D-alanyl-D-alanine ligase [Bacillota bacterium]
MEQDLIGAFAFLLAYLIVLLFSSKRFIHLLQLEAYQAGGYLKSACRSFLRLWLPLAGIYAFALTAGAVFGFLLSANMPSAASYIGDGALIAGGALYAALTSTKKAKKPLVFTVRIKRLYGCLALLYFILAGLLSIVSIETGYGYWIGSSLGSSLGSLILSKAALYVLLPLLPLLVALGSLIMLPIENGIRKWYFNDAKNKIALLPHLKKVGITGSYGKTSTKFILGTLLSEKYKVLVPPSSFNTPMGLTRMIRERLDGTYDVFIAEMGARRAGEVRELCELVKPQYGILTSVGKQHLETFKSLENITKTKYELIESLPKDGMGFFSSDNDICFELYMAAKKPKALYGLTDRGEPLLMTARDISVGTQGSRFELVCGDGGSARCTTKLLGLHNITNIIGCAAVAYTLGLSLSEIARGIGKLEPVEHRLQIIPTNNGVTVIDDSFNSNP